MIRIKVEATAGDRIEDVAREMIEASARLGVGMICKFNGVDMYNLPNDTPKSVVERWRAAFDLTRRHLG